MFVHFSKLQGYLASIKDEKIGDFLHNLYRQKAWIGARRSKTNNAQFVWSDETPVTYASWMRGEPNNVNEGCVINNFKHPKQWIDHTCEIPWWAFWVHPQGFFCEMDSMDTMPISTISTWGPSFTVSLDLKVQSFTPPNMKLGAWAELLRLTTTDNDCCRIGDRAPAIFTHKDGYLHITTQIGNNGNRAWYVTIQENRWYTLEMSQYKLHDKVTQLPRYNSYHTNTIIPQC